jgi:AraC family transcriptional regulator of adaptative response/methylated-DNA-[protein]-cysteine methyltransferase
VSRPGRLHDLFVTFEAVTPGQYRALGADLEIRCSIHPIPFNPAGLATMARGICGLHFLPEADASAARDTLAEARLVEASGHTQSLVERIFAPLPPGEPRPFHLLLKGSNFQVQVWQALLAIPPGALLSHSDVAAYPGLARRIPGRRGRRRAQPHRLRDLLPSSDPP